MTHPAISATVVAFASIIAAFLYSRSGVLYLFYANAPGRLQHEVNVKNPVVKFADVVRNCEDAYLNDAEGWAILSCDPGRDTWNTVMGTFIDSRASPETGLYLWNYGKAPDSSPEQLKLLDFAPAPGDLHPLGIEYERESQTLFVTNHAESGSRIDVFRLFASELAATHIRTLRHPLIHAPNSITALSEHEILITNDHYFLRRDHPLIAKLENVSGLRLGSVVHVDLSKPEVTATKLTNVAFPNGIVFLNTSTVVVASTIDPSINFFTFTRDAASNVPQLTKTNSLTLPCHVDNLSLDSDGALLLAGHPHAPTIEAVAENNRFCHSVEDAQKCAEMPRAASWVQEWSEAGGLRTLYLGDELGTACTAVRDVKRGVGLAVGLYGGGLLTWEA